ncbi:MAG: alpha-2-macroglobulin family protein, partial [Myxococcota bacterium]
NGKPVANAEVVLAVVDEGVLRLTNHHAPNPVPAMHPGQPLAVTIDDNRRAFAEILARSHTGGDGPGSGAQSLVGARKKFVRTALWKPGLRTDASGHVDVGFELPDNLTRFRIMAVALDAQGRGGSVEDGFYVRKSLMIQPAVPRFAVVGDVFDAAVMVHNNTEAETPVTVTLGKRRKQVTIAAKGRKRVAFSVEPRKAGTRKLVFAVADGEGTERDRVVAKIPVQAPGLSEAPRLSGSFTGGQTVRLEVPEGVSAGNAGDEFVTITLGERLWPELAGRLEYLVDYPHGCVEQTTSSTVPLLAAREMLPRLGVAKWSTSEIDTMIKAGVDRLDTMRTASGGLAYWPGGHEPNLYGTAYAMHAVVGAKRAGVKVPGGLLEGMRDYLLSQLTSDSMPWGNGPEVRAAVALSLAEAEGLPPESADALFEGKGEQGAFGLAALAIAMSTLDNESQRVGTVLDDLEALLSDDGEVLGARPEHEFQYFGSNTRSRALAAMALGRLRPGSTRLPGLIHELLQAPEGYTTQSTAYALLSLTEHIDRQEPLASENRVRALLDGVPVQVLLGEVMPLGPGAMQYKVPLDRLRGRTVTLTMEAETDQAVGFSVAARWRRPLSTPGSRMATTGERAPDLWRVVTDVKGNPVDLGAIEAGATLRVVLLARLPRDRVEDQRMGYLALTDRLPAGFEALQPDLWTVASVPELSGAHPLSDLIRWGSDASHVELRDDRAHFYFDRIWGDYVHATYLMRATTPGRFSAAPASAELMYETDGTGYSAGLQYEVKR